MSLWKLLRGRHGTADADTDDIQIDGVTNSLLTVDSPHGKIHAGCHYYMEGFTTLADTNTLYVKLVTPDTDRWSHFRWEIEASGILETNLYEKPTGGMTGGARAVIHASNRNVDCESGSHTGGTSATIMTDSTASFTIDALIGDTIYNQTDGSSGVVTDNDATTVTVVALAGGADNEWKADDVYEINTCDVIVTSGVVVATALGLVLSSKKVGAAGFKTVSGGSSDRTDEIVLRRNTTYLRHFLSSSADNVVSFRASFYEHTNKH